MEFPRLLSPPLSAPRPVLIKQNAAQDWRGIIYCEMKTDSSDSSLLPQTWEWRGGEKKNLRTLIQIKQQKRSVNRGMATIAAPPDTACPGEPRWLWVLIVAGWHQELKISWQYGRTEQSTARSGGKVRLRLRTTWRFGIVKQTETLMRHLLSVSVHFHLLIAKNGHVTTDDTLSTL